MAEWKEYKLGEIANVTKLAGFEYTKHFEYIEDGEIISLRALNVRKGNLDLTDVKRISKSVSNNLIRSKLFKGDILLTYVGANIGQFALIDENDKYHLAPNICRIRAGEKCIPYFLFSYFRTQLFQDSLANYSVGSSQPTLPMGNIRQIEIPLPPLPEQQAIAEVLSSLDDKIELLHRQNNTLEGLAETIFRQWFVEEAERNWERGKLGDYVQCLKGKKPNIASETYTEGLVPQILIETFDTGKTLFSEPESMVIANEKDILMVMDGASSGRVEIGFNGVVGSTIGLFKPLSDFNFPLYLFHFIKTRESHVRENTTGSAIPHADKALILNLDLAYPNEEKIKEFESLAQTWFKKKNQTDHKSTPSQNYATRSCRN